MQSLQAKFEEAQKALDAQGYSVCGCTYRPPPEVGTCGRCNHGAWNHRKANPTGDVEVLVSTADGRIVPVRYEYGSCMKPMAPRDLERERAPREERGIVAARPCAACSFPLSEKGPHVTTDKGLADQACVEAQQRAQDDRVGGPAGGVVVVCSLCGAQALRKQLSPHERGPAHEACIKALARRLPT